MENFYLEIFSVFPLLIGVSLIISWVISLGIPSEILPKIPSTTAQTISLEITSKVLLVTPLRLFEGKSSGNFFCHSSENYLGDSSGIFFLKFVWQCVGECIFKICFGNSVEKQMEINSVIPS